MTSGKGCRVAGIVGRCERTKRHGKAGNQRAGKGLSCSFIITQGNSHDPVRTALIPSESRCSKDVTTSNWFYLLKVLPTQTLPHRGQSLEPSHLWGTYHIKNSMDWSFPSVLNCLGDGGGFLLGDGCILAFLSPCSLVWMELAQAISLLKLHIGRC